METAEVSSGIDGDKLYQERARKALPILVRQAKAGQKIFYADLADELGMPNPRNLNYPLGSIGTTLKELSEKWSEDIPQLQCLVVNQTTGLPGEGISGFISDTRQFARLGSKQKKALVDGVLAKIFGYNKWNLVLDGLGLHPAPITENIKKKVRRTALNRGNGGGEGEQHKRLKMHIKENPECVDLRYNGLSAETEKRLPSGDSIDVFFENKRNWIGVEVKSEISDETDILRGLYQCIKYHAVMESLLAVLDEQKNVEVVLALGCEFPDTLVAVKNTLGVKVVENIKV